MRFSIAGTKAIINACNKISEPRLNAIVKLNMTEIYNRGKQAGGTPVDTGELRQSLGLRKDGNAYNVGYTKEYAPDVEYGYRTVGGGFVRGQHYMQSNVTKQRPRLIQDIRREIEKGGGI